MYGMPEGMGIISQIIAFTWQKALMSLTYITIIILQEIIEHCVGWWLFDGLAHTRVTKGSSQQRPRQ